MRTLTSVLITLAFLTGCTFSQDGIGIYWPVETTQEEYEEIHAQLMANAKSAGLSGVTPEMLGVIVTGSTGPYRPFTDANIQEHYDEYVELAIKRRGDDHLVLSYEQFKSRYVGWTSVAPFAIPGVGKIAIGALVETDIASSVEFASGVTSFLVGDTDDYVAVKTNLDGWYYISSLLCPDNKNYYSCTKKYSSGFFDQLTGQEIDPKTGVPDDGGDLIDTETFERIK